jgi:hypothetical protein
MQAAIPTKVRKKETACARSIDGHNVLAASRATKGEVEEYAASWEPHKAKHRYGQENWGVMTIVKRAAVGEEAEVNKEGKHELYVTASKMSVSAFHLTRIIREAWSNKMGC